MHSILRTRGPNKLSCLSPDTSVISTIQTNEASLRGRKTFIDPGFCFPVILQEKQRP